MASFTKRNGRWRARVRRSDLPPITKSFPTKASALKWSQRVRSDPEKFLAEQLPEAHQLMNAITRSLASVLVSLTNVPRSFVDVMIYSLTKFLYSALRVHHDLNA